MNIVRLFSIVLGLLFCIYGLISEEVHDNSSSPELVQLSQQQIKDGGIDITSSASVKLKQSFSVPAKISINEQKQALVVAKAPGIVTKISKNIGDLVTIDEELVLLESKEMSEAKASYITATKRQKLAEQTLATEEALKEKKISSEQDYLRALLAAEEAKISLEVAQQQLYLLGMNETEIKQLSKDELKGLCCYSLKSPLKGEIISKNATLGSLIGSDQEVFKIADLDTVWVELGIYANDLVRIKPGHKIMIKPLKDEKPAAQAVITHISPVIDEHTRTATAIALLPNENRNWYPGAYVRAEIVVDETIVPVAVLRNAIQEIDGKKIVFVLHPDGFEKRTVVLGQSDKDYVEIIDGLQVGVDYAASNTFLLKAEDGKKDAEL